MTEILFKNVNGKRIQMTEEEVLEFEKYREAASQNQLQKEEDERNEKELEMKIFESMCERLGITEEEKKLLLKKF